MHRYKLSLFVPSDLSIYTFVLAYIIPSMCSFIFRLVRQGRGISKIHAFYDIQSLPDKTWDLSHNGFVSSWLNTLILVNIIQIIQSRNKCVHLSTTKLRWHVQNCDQGSLLPKWFNFNPSMDKWLHPLSSVRSNYLSIPKFRWLHRWSLGMDKFDPTLYCECEYFSVLGLKLKRVKERGYWSKHCFWSKSDMIVFEISFMSSYTLKKMGAQNSCI